MEKLNLLPPMKKLILISALLFSFNTSSFPEAEEEFNVEPITCIAALSKGRDAAEITGERKLFSYLTDVQNDIYTLLPGFPKYSEIESIKSKFEKNPSDLILACIERYQ